MNNEIKKCLDAIQKEIDHMNNKFNDVNELHTKAILAAFLAGLRKAKTIIKKTS